MNPRNLTGVGIDILEISRVRSIRNLHRVAELVLTDQEYKTFINHPNPCVFFASRFSLKEAVIKASPQPLTYHDVQIEKTGKKPVVHLPASAGSLRMLVSLSHSNEYVAAYAIASHETA